MPFSLRAWLRGLALLLLLALLVLQRIDVAQTEDVRSFQMALLTYPYLTNFDWEDTAPYVDIPTFTSGSPQPPGSSIMILNEWGPAYLSSLGVDWSRILAAQIDEPYVTALNDSSAENPACTPNGPRNTIVRDTYDGIVDAAQDIHGRAPRTRVWLNFSQSEVDWMRDKRCPAALNDSLIDVVSLDNYDVDFDDIEDDYAWFIERWGAQQLALVPATSYDDAGSYFSDRLRANKTAQRLKAYFAYANLMNAECNMEAGRLDGTGGYDRCRVWVVAGWSSEPWLPIHGGWISLLHPNDEGAALILDEWASEFSKLRRP